MFARMPPSVNAARDGQEEYGDAWPLWPSPGLVDTSSSEWGPFPDATDHLDDFTLSLHSHALIAADGTSPSNTVDGQKLTQGVVCDDQFSNALEPTASSLLFPSQALTNLDGNVGHAATLLATGLSNRQFLDQPLQYIPDTAVANELQLDQVTEVQPPVLDTYHVQVPSKELTLASLMTPDILNTDPLSTGFAISSSGGHSRGNPSPGAISSRTISTATLSATSSPPDIIDTQHESLVAPKTTLRVVQYGQPNTIRGTMSSRPPIPTPPTPANPSNRVTKQKRNRAVGMRVNVMRSVVGPKTITKRDQTGRLGGDFMTWGLDQHLRSQGPDAGRSTSLTNRAHSACKRCNKMKQACIASEDDYSPCNRCKAFWLRNFFDRRNTKGGLQYQPCFRIEIVDLKLHRLGPTKYDTLRTWVRNKQQRLQEFSGDTTQNLFLTQGFGEGFSNALWLKVARFNPVGPEDRTSYFWTDNQGRLRSHEMPPYFISDLEHARTSVGLFLRDARNIYIDGLLQGSDPLIRRTFDIARALSAMSPLISDALDVWVSGRFIEDHWKVFCGGPQIGATETDEPGHPYHGFIPVTPMMDTQLDDLVIRELIKPRLTSFLAKLKKKLAEKKRENWLELFLAMFVMMSNIGWVVKDMIAMTTWKGLKPGNRGGVLTQGYMHACKTMLAHFHFACAGSVPLTMDFDKMVGSDKAYHGMTQDQLEYVRFLRSEIVRQGTKLARWKDLSMYKDDAYWVYQLLCQDWNGEYKHPGEIDDFTEDDFLSSSST